MSKRRLLFFPSIEQIESRCLLDGSPAQVAFGAGPEGQVTLDTLKPITPAVTVTVEDSSGNPVDGANVTLTLTSSSQTYIPIGLDTLESDGSASSGPVTASTQNGVATFSDLTLIGKLAEPIQVELVATVGNLTATSQSFSVASPSGKGEGNSGGGDNSDPAAQLSFDQEPNDTVAGGKFHVTVNVEDDSGELANADHSKVQLSISGGDGKLLGTTTATDKNGVATFSNLSIQKAGTYTLQASDGDLASDTSDSFVISAAAIKKLSFASIPANVSSNSAFNVSVEATDQYGNAAGNGSTVDLVLGSHPKSAASLNLSATVVDGSADFDSLTLDTSGNYTLKASDGKAKATSNKFTVS